MDATCGCAGQTKAKANTCVSFFISSSILCLQVTCAIIVLSLHVSAVSGLSYHHLSSASISKLMPRDEAQNAIHSKLFPAQQFDDRMNAGRDAQGLTGGGVVQADDPRLAFTYAEFPLESFDALIDAALEVMGGREPPKMIRLVDLGSGCARLVLYAALSRGWDVRGIEIGPELHEKAMSVLERGIDCGYFQAEGGQSDHMTAGATLLLGAICMYPDVLGSADIVFAYSTVFPAVEKFNVELGALVLQPEWSQMLAAECRGGCIAITTDRALDPKFGWELIKRLDVENPEVLGSTGYIHILRK